MTKLIALCGRKGSGKDEAAKILVGYAGFQSIAFADPLREISKIAFGLTDKEMSDRMLKEASLRRYPYDSPREILQYVGTEGFRSRWPEVWIECAKRRIREINAPGVVITDCRFLNEAAAVREMGGSIIKIDADDRLGPNEDPHPSEAEIPLIEADLVIENNGTLDDYLELCRSTFEVIIENV